MEHLDRLRKRAALRAKVSADRAAVDRIQVRHLEIKSKPPSPLDRLKHRKSLRQDPTYAEVARVCNLPVKQPMTTEELEEFSRAHVLRSAFEEGFRLLTPQAEGLRDYKEVGGLLGSIGVGWGKTLLSQMITHEAYKKGLGKILLFVPSAVLGQLVNSMFPLARRKVPISYPVHVLGGRSLKARRMIARSGKRGLYVYTYELLSRKDASDNLNDIKPELIICDEADYLGNPSAARTKRLMNYVRDAKPEGVCVSGTITSQSIKDYYHLIKWCLGQNCPLPLNGNLASDWATKIDAHANYEGEAKGPLLPLIEWAWDEFPRENITEDTAGFRLAYKLRMTTTPGVVSTGDAEIGPSLILHNTPVSAPENEPGWEQLEHYRKQVTDMWLTPNGDEIEHAIHTFKWLYELSAGFYNELVFPEPEAFAERERITPEAAESILEDAHEHHAAHQAYASALRKWLEVNAEDGLDTPMLVGLSMSQHGADEVGDQLYDLWKDLKLCEKYLMEGCYELGMKTPPQELKKRIASSLRDSRVVRVCPFKINHAVAWAKQLKGGAILWIHHQGIGQWLTEALAEAGLNPLYCPAGHNDAILDHGNKDRIIVASMRAHGTGKNLQHFHQQLFVQWPRSARLAEQTLGRMHRNGQLSNEVWAHTMTTTDFDGLCFAASLNDALYIHQTTGNRQKLIYATYSPGLPKVFPSSVLRERGFRNKQLSTQQQEILLDKFGDVSDQ